jgi:hypothetical protein
VELAICYYKAKIDGWFRRTFKEQAGGAELIATLVIVGIVLILAFAFKDKLVALVKSIWNNLIVNGDEDTSQTSVAPSWD